MTWIAFWALALVARPFAAGAQEPDPFVAVADADPLELARVARRFGDRAVLERLAVGRPVVVQLAAARAAPSLRVPEASLPRLVELAGGRDSLLAPAAALSILRIVTDLTPDAVAAHEISLSELAAVRAGLAELAADESARADIRRASAIAAELLGALSGPTQSP